MNDEYIYTTAPDGRQFRACIYESSYVPLGMCKWQIEIRVPEVEWWYIIQKSLGAWLWPDAQVECQQRLEWWMANWRDMPVAREVMP